MRSCPHCGTHYDGDAAFCTRDGTRLDPADDSDHTLALGDQGMVLGTYRLLELIGEGGMGRVYLAEHTRLGRKVALKMLRPEVAAHPQAVKRFFAEARAVNRLVHENVVEITDFFEGEGADDPRFYIMELLQGQSLRQLLEHEGAQPVERVGRIGRQLASALAAVHDAGIVHRDLKPDNVFLTERGGTADFVKLLDFGIARHLDPEDDAPRTAAGAVIGTPEYMSPEQASGSGGVDRRSDIYALGVILYEMVSGQQPIKGQTFSETLVRQMTFTPPPPGQTLPDGLPPALEQLIMSCLAKDPAQRPQSMAEVERALTPAAQQGTVVLAAGALRTPAAQAPLQAPRTLATDEAVEIGKAAPGTRTAPSPAAGQSDFAAAGSPAAAAAARPVSDAPSDLAAPRALSVAATPTDDSPPRKSKLAYVVVALVIGGAVAAGAGWVLLRGSGAPIATSVERPAAPAAAPVDAQPAAPANVVRDSIRPEVPQPPASAGVNEQPAAPTPASAGVNEPPAAPTPARATPAPARAEPARPAVQRAPRPAGSRAPPPRTQQAPAPR